MICVFRCPTCGDQMHYSVENQVLKCDTCGCEESVDTYDIENIEYEGASELSDELEQFNCVQCGAIIMMKPQTAALKCSYCGAHLAAYAMREGEISPEKIIPFSLTKEEAETSFAKWWVEHPTMPKFQRDKMKFEINGIYVPIWISDIQTKCGMQARITAEIVELQSDYRTLRKNSLLTMALNEGQEVSNRYVTYDAKRVIQSDFENIPMNASTNFSSDLFNGIEPYEYKAIRPFNPAYLSGLQAERYELDQRQILPGALKRARKFAEEQCIVHLEEIGGPNGGIDKILNKFVTAVSNKVQYALVPVWVCSYYYNGVRHLVYVNGQTGKADGEVIFANKKYEIDVAGYAIATFVESFPLAMLFFALGIDRNFGYFFYIIFSALSGLAPYISFRRLLKRKTGMGSPLVTQKVEDEKKHSLTTRIFIKLLIGAGLLFYTLSLYKFLTERGAGIILSSKLPESFLVAFLIAAFVGFMFARSHVKELQKREVSEYTDYLPMSHSVVLEGSEEVVHLNKFI